MSHTLLMLLMKQVNLRFLLGVLLVWLYLFVGLLPLQASAESTYRPTYTLKQNEHIKLTGGFLTSGSNPVFYDGKFGGTINDSNRAYINVSEQAIYFLYDSSSTLYITHYDYIYNSNTAPRDQAGACWPALKLNGITATVAGVSKASGKETDGCTKSAQDLANMSPGAFDNIDFAEQARASQKDAEVAPLVQLVCGKLAPPAGLGGSAAQTMQREYDVCKQAAIAAYDSCYVSASSVGSSVVADTMNKPESRAKCFMGKIDTTKYSGFTLPQVVTAISEGQVAAAAVANNASEQIACASKGGTWKPGADANTGTCEMPSTGAGDAPTSLCGFDGDSMEWVICPVTVGLQAFMKALQTNIEGLMFFPTADVFNKPGAGQATDSLHTAWASFRNIAIAIIVIAGLAMVISQALGFEILDAYTIRKLLPRLGVALVGIALSWNLMQFFIELTNDIGSWTHDILVGPFASMPVANVDGSNKFYNWGALLGLVITGVPKLYFLGGIGFLTILLIIGLIILIAFMIFGLRWIVIMLCLLLAPLAMASYVLPGTQKIWSFWKNTTITSLAIFPVIMALLASGEVMARVSSQVAVPGGYLLVVVLFFAPILLIIPIAQKFSGVLGGAIGWASGLSSKAMGRGNKFLHDTSDYRKGEYATGAKRGPALVTGYARRSALSRQGGFTSLNPLARKTRAQYRQAEKKLIQDAAAERAEKDKGFSLGATDATLPAIYANSRGDYLREYVNRNRGMTGADGKVLTDAQLTQRARMRMGQLEAGTGAIMGSRAMKAAAFRGQTMDGAGWFDEANHETDFKAIAEASNHLIKAGVMSDEDIGGILGQNQSRADFSGMTFSQRVGIATMGERGNGALDAEQENLLRSQSYQSMRNSQAELGNLRTAKKISREGGKRLNAVLTDNMTGFKSEGNRLLTGSNDLDTLASEFATFANFQDMASSASIDAREQFATQLKQQYYTEELSAGMQTILKPLLDARGGSVSTQEIMDYCRGNSGDVRADQQLIDLFTARRREYSSGRMSDAAKRGAMVDPATSTVT
jgi:hypothetical protein